MSDLYDRKLAELTGKILRLNSKRKELRTSLQTLVDSAHDVLGKGRGMDFRELAAAVAEAETLLRKEDS